MKRWWSSYLTLTLREVESLFFTPMAYIVMTVVLLMNGVTFWTSLAASGGRIDVAVREFLGQSTLFWFVILLVPPLVTMRLFAEERRTGTIEMLMTAPVTDLAVVLAKFTGALFFLATLWGPTLLYIAIEKSYGALPDRGALIASYMGIFLVGALLTAVGCFTSALTDNQIVAAICAVIANLVIFFVPALNDVIEWKPMRQVLEEIWFFNHFRYSFSKGIVDSGQLVFYVALTSLLIFLTVRVVEARKWK
jgi:gliding motility-associated transport system permease protein